MIKPNASSHWYTPEGEPAYNATLREARKQILYPSVTSVIGILDKPAITAWKVNTMLDCAWEVRSFTREWMIDKETWKERVEKEWQEETTKAAERGTAIHDYIESYITGSGNRVKGYEKQCEMIETWIDDNVDSAVCEQSFGHLVNGLGYGGRIDCHGFLRDSRPFVLDFKTQDLKSKNKPTYYPEFAIQLAAYKYWLDSIDDLDHVALSVIIDTSDIQCIHSKEYMDEELGKGLNKFGSILNTFYIVKELI